MTGRKVLEMIALYRKCFKDQNCRKIEFPSDELNDSGTSERARLKTLEHCHAMLDQLERLTTDSWPEKREEVLTRLAFIQGCLWSLGIFCLDELKKL